MLESERITERQLPFLEKLLREKPNFARANADKIGDVKELSKVKATILIDAVLKAPIESFDRSGDALSMREIEVGSYWTLTGDVARVRRSENTGRLYAEVLNESVGKFGYRKGLIFRLKKRMTLEEAKDWGARLGRCCVCGAKLTDNNSVDAGIGPVCAKKV